MSTLWLAILAASAGCYALKLAGLSAPRAVLEDPRVRRASVLLPVALLAALAATQTLTTKSSLVLDARAAAVSVAIVAVLARANFLVVVASACATAALLRLIAG
jgi:branched-subunit amino acid transport protein